MLRNTIIVITCSLLLGLIAGCQTLSRDKPQQIRKYSRISELNRRMAAEDVDKWLLLDRPSGLSQWHVPADR
jgi:hypothetical protein